MMTFADTRADQNLRNCRVDKRETSERRLVCHTAAGAQSPALDIEIDSKSARFVRWWL
jgi:hypothetical protein